MKFLYFLLTLLLVALCEARDPKCLQPRDPGMCMAYIPMYAFDSAKGSCEFFVYGGCQGNDNRFPTLESCQSACH
ncbi:kunitz-like toxin PcKuz3 isoform X4 [Spodoptera frugiperda]|uniref:Kunitz-like toxin PcKuz3 isoform X4 n=1 Tax=Spodoptera frugiperda TaxID=7108 RepID=A0A9R0DIS1_SPOFR|nr:kunitz-like toxin PcKuz3 isoform X4 [Spodoptera frugiperda]